MSYINNLVDRLWEYAGEKFQDPKDYLDPPFRKKMRPPVFRKERADWNIISDPQSSPGERKKLCRILEIRHRHRWFRSMRSSQALAQSVFGNLEFAGKTAILEGIQCDDGLPAFGPLPENLVLEHEVDFLKEPRKTSVDVFLSGSYRIAVECKMAEVGIGTCSRPRLKPEETASGKDFCDGSLTFQRARDKRCSLSSEGIRYWDYIPQLTKWTEDVDRRPCPLGSTYQLVRNIIAACGNPDGSVSPEGGHAVLIYDERNPHFSEGGKGMQAYRETVEALKHSHLLRKCSWQRLVNHLRSTKTLPWLTEELGTKYGF